MTVAQAVFDAATQTYVERPFPYRPEPVRPGRVLDDDLDLYRALTTQIGLMPSFLFLLFLGDSARQLFLRRAPTPGAWAAFRAEFVRQNPDIVAKDATITATVAALASANRAGARKQWAPTVPEASVAVAFLRALPAGVTLTADAPLPGGTTAKGHVRRCDLHLRSGRRDERVEVVGSLDSAGRPRTMHGWRYIERTLARRAEAYAALSLPPPVTVWADEVADPHRRTQAVAGVLARFP